MERVATAAGWAIRPFRMEDGEACLRIFSDWVKTADWLSNPKPSILELGAVLTRSRVWVADVDKAGVVGFLSMSAKTRYVDHLFIDLDWRFCGIGSGLLETARASANRPLELTVQDVNIRARRFYQRLGWIDMGAEKSNRGEPSRRLRSPE